tara:strand:- start:305 stop:430 length:126 start_codon:yes stop_codon:yes gene_type:complete
VVQVVEVLQGVLEQIDLVEQETLLQQVLLKVTLELLDQLLV